VFRGGCRVYRGGYRVSRVDIDSLEVNIGQLLLG